MYRTTDLSLTSSQVLAGGTCSYWGSGQIYGGLQNTPAGLPTQAFFNTLGVSTSTAIESDEYTLSSFEGPLYVFAGNNANVCLNSTPAATPGCSTGWVSGEDLILSNLVQINPGDRIKFQLTSAGSAATTVVSTIQIGAIKLHWKVTTAP